MPKFLYLVMCAFAAAPSIATAQCPLNDTLEPNDVCTTGIPLTSGSFGGLALVDADVDFYLVTLPAFSTASIQAVFSEGPPDSFLYRTRTFASPCGIEIESSYNVGLVPFTYVANESGAPSDRMFAFSIEDFAGATTQVCREYTLEITIFPQPVCAMSDDARPIR